MTGLLAVLAGLLAFLLVPLALSAQTALLLVPGHGLLTVLASTGAIVAGLAGRPETARRWGLMFLAASALVVGALEIGALVRGQHVAYWGIPWTAMLLWGWIPPVLAGVMGVVGEARERRLVRGTVRRRKVVAQNSDN